MSPTLNGVLCVCVRVCVLAWGVSGPRPSGLPLMGNKTARGNSDASFSFPQNSQDISGAIPGQRNAGDCSQPA